ncbi:MAG TPA: hypothetical protein PLE19_14830 [Planctomycetota bacterium]|nr:hypothetical protein [Planctomycetota bacterium]HRR79390.1 hypothetical protein [Planctomycetota bacterium]HRT96611.1 hypothetical protein [Planctomycetota bacterium]
MTRAALFASALCLLTLASLLAAKEEILPGKKGKERDQAAQDNPLYDVAGDMDTAARRLKEAKTDDTTQDVQQAIIDKLDKLIEAAQQQDNKPPQGGQGDERKPQKRPEPQPQPKSEEEKKKAEEQQKKPASAEERKKQERPGIGRPGQGDPSGQIHTDANEWGNLPPAVRDQLLQTQGEGFPLKYRELLRRYYLDLANPKE